MCCGLLYAVRVAWRVLRPPAALEGGTEPAPTSTSADPLVALKYALDRNTSGQATVLKLNTDSFMNRGVDLRFCSVFPEEREYLYPPCTCVPPRAHLPDCCPHSHSCSNPYHSVPLRAAPAATSSRTRSGVSSWKRAASTAAGASRE